MEPSPSKALNIGSELLEVIERGARHSMRGRRAIGIMFLGAISAVFGLAVGETQVVFAGSALAVLAMGFVTYYTGEIIKDNLLLKEAAKKIGLDIKK